MPVAGQIKMPLIGNGSGAPIKEWNTYTYRVNPVSSLAVPILVKKVVAKEKIKRLAVIYDQTQDAQAGDAEVCKQLGRQARLRDSLPSRRSAPTTRISRRRSPKIRSLRPDAIYVAAATGDGIKVVSQIREVGHRQAAYHRLRLVPGSGLLGRNQGRRERGLHLARAGPFVAERPN